MRLTDVEMRRTLHTTRLEHCTVGPGATRVRKVEAALNIGEFNLGNALAAWLAGAAIGAGFGYASANIVGAMMTAAGSALAFVTPRLDARERRHI